ncbi:MAG TPA: hypothetical protein VII66_03275 [Gemmatimonadaceae bacterium]
MRICFDLGGVFYPGASDEDNALALQALLEALIAINRVYLRRYKSTRKLYEAGVRYARTQVWDSIPDLVTRRFGDCKSLSAMYVAERREAGHQSRPVFRFATNPQTGHKDFHILVQEGRHFEDPSRKLGMEEFHRSRGLWLFPQ